MCLLADLRRCLVGLAAVLTTLSAGCDTPCASNEDCPPDQHCGQGSICAFQCIAHAECGVGEQCVRGACTQFGRPEVTWLAPAVDADVGERFDVDVEVRFRGERASVSLTRDLSEPGNVCAPLVPQVAVLQGDASQSTTHRVTFRDVDALGERFGLTVEGDVAGATQARSRTFRGAPRSESGVQLALPSERWLDADAAATFALSAPVAPRADTVWVWTEPLDRPATPRVPAGVNALSLEDQRVPFVRGAQVVWLETQRGGQTERCGVGAFGESADEPRPLGATLVYETADGTPTHARLRLVYEGEIGEVDECTSTDLGRLCTGGRETRGLRRYGEDALWANLDDGIYGVAVEPGAASGAVRLQLRVSLSGRHAAWIGPRTARFDLGEVWMPVRVYVIDGTATVEQLDAIQMGLPSDPPSFW